jgi:enoyl-CoA hydratase
MLDHSDSGSSALSMPGGGPRVPNRKPKRYERRVTALETADGATILRFDNGPVNAADLDMLNVIIESMRSVQGPVVLTGAGRAFSAGVDLRALVDGGTDYAERFVAALSEAFLAIYNHPAPVVAAINGHAIAGGCVLAMCADVRLMSGGTIGLTELSVGVPFPVAALEICRAAMGTSATRAALGAKTIDADTALARGWVDEVVGKDELVDTALATARELGRYASAAYAATKAQLHKPVHALIDVSAATDAEVRDSWISEETRSRIVGFLDALARGR